MTSLEAIHQVLSPIYEPMFSDSSFGFRPGRSAHMALLQAKSYVESGREWVVYMDLEKFFDTRPKDITLSIYGEGLGGTLWKTNGSKKLSPNYKDVLYG